MREYVRLRGEHEAANRVAEKAKAAREEQELRLWDFLESAGIKTINHELGRITRNNYVRGIVTDDEAFVAWCENNDMTGVLIKRDVRRAELYKIVRERLADLEQMPDGVEPLIKQTISFTRS